MNKKFCGISVLVVGMILSALFTIKPTLAVFTSQDKVVNNFVGGNVDIGIEEELDEECKDFSEGCKKEVYIKNESFQTDAIIRVALVPYWQDGSGNAWPGDVSGVTLRFGEKVNDTDTENPNLVDILSTNEGWIDGCDGYYYYNRLVPEGTSTKQLLSSVTVNIPQELEDRYNGKTLIVDVKAEAVQPTWDAVEKVWPQLNEGIKDMIKNMIKKIPGVS